MIKGFDRDNNKREELRERDDRTHTHLVDLVLGLYWN